MAWLNLNVSGGAGKNRTQGQLDALLRRQQERERLIAQAREPGNLAALTDEQDASKRKGQRPRIDPVGTRSRRTSGVGQIGYRAPLGGNFTLWPTGAAAPIVLDAVSDEPPLYDPPELDPLIEFIDNGGINLSNSPGTANCSANLSYVQFGTVEPWRSTGNQATDGIVLVLPTGGRSGIVVERRYFYVHNLAWAFRTWDIRGWANLGNIDFGDTPQCTFEFYRSNGGQVEYYEQPLFEVTYTKAFTFNDKAARPIDVPAQVLAKLEEIMVFPTPTITTSQEFAFFESESAGETGTPVYATAKNVSFVFPAGYPGTGLLKRQLRQNYGLGRLRTSEHAPFSFFTPAVYSFLTSSNPFFQSGDIDHTNYQACRTQHLLGAELPDEFINVPFPSVELLNPDAPVDESIIDVTYNFTATSTEPLDVQTPVAAESLAPSSKYPPLNFRLQDGMSSYLFWDWGQPAYCRQQALSLGFSVADLQP